MAGVEQDGIEERLVGVRMLQNLQSLLQRLHPSGTQRDRAGNRSLFFDHAAGLILLTFFNPTLKSLRELVAASRLKQIKKKLGCSSASLGSLSESLRLFEPALLAEILEELLAEIPDSPTAPAELKQHLRQIPTAVDGSLLKALPQVTQACFARRGDLGWKLHTHFEILRGVPTLSRITNATGRQEANEKAVLQATLQADRCYVTDRGYEQFALFNQIVQARSSYVCRVRNDHQFRAESQLELTATARASGVLEDALGQMGSPKSKRIVQPDHPQRRIVVAFTNHEKRGGRRAAPASQNIVLVTNLLDVPAEIIALLYRQRWLIELFFRWLKSVFACRHLLSEAQNGIEIQMYCALIAFLLVQKASGRDVKPNQWTYKLLCLYTQGWADEDEVLAHLASLSQGPAQKTK